MTKLAADPTKCDNCVDDREPLDSQQELILKIIKDKFNECNEFRNSDIESDKESVKYCCVCKKFIPEFHKYKLKDSVNPTNTYGTINPVVVINIFKDEDADHIPIGGVINEAFLNNEDDTRFDLRIIPEVDEEYQSDPTLERPASRGDTPFGHSDKWRTSSKRSMVSMKSHNSTQLRTMTPSRRRSSAITSNSSEKRRESIRNMLFGDPELSLRRFSQDIRSTVNEEKKLSDEYETYKVIFLQVFVPFLIAGFGNVGAGLILDYVQHWDVFQSVSELFILIAS
ncbi:unnamed protein product [Oppiella nova]|uniref:Uncharacterized protein n=1 Tax=Oppiella nova TaxID=334625 RepID=A0A7R9QD01_9ACAR|nr:unnamed protein product [Oppiella nova]CAG2163432.1 unnamed protein product [Oppiella nova]